MHGENSVRFTISCTIHADYTVPLCMHWQCQVQTTEKKEEMKDKKFLNRVNCQHSKKKDQNTKS